MSFELTVLIFGIVCGIAGFAEAFLAGGSFSDGAKVQSFLGGCASFIMLCMAGFLFFVLGEVRSVNRMSPEEIQKNEEMRVAECDSLDQDYIPIIPKPQDPPDRLLAER